MLYLIGLGLNGKLPAEIIDEIKDYEIYLEGYTSFLPDDWSLPLPYKKLLRKDVESPFLINEAKNKNVALLIIGDPFSATTHFTLYKEALENGIKVKIYHNSSIFSAISKTGLHIYKFGKTTTIPLWKKNYHPTSFYQIILQNMSIDAHTLLLLDVDEGKPMEINTALKILKQVDVKSKIKHLLVISRLGWKDEKISFGSLSSLLNKYLGKPPFSIVIPSKKLHFTEKEALKLFY